MVRVFRCEDADLGLLADKTLAIVGYGNQGRPQALNLRDSGLSVAIGARGADSPSHARARQDGFEPLTIAEAVRQSDIIHILLPDEVHARNPSRNNRLPSPRPKLRQRPPRPNRRSPSKPTPRPRQVCPISLSDHSWTLNS